MPIPNHSSIIGVDLGGTKIHVVRYGMATWQIDAEERVPTHAEQQFPSVLEDMLRLVQKLRTPETAGIGVGIPGLVRKEDGIVLRLPNIPGGEGYPLLRELESRLGSPVFIENDASCFTLAEAVHGAGKGEKVVVGITLGTGVGGGIVIDGEIFHGHHGFAAEIGHMLLKPGEPPYAAEDHRGDVEQFFSGTAMGKRCAQAQDPRDYLEGKVCAFMHKSIFEEVAWLCTNVSHLLDPSVIVFGGSAGHALKPHLPKVTEELRRWMLKGTPLPHLRVAELKDAATRGAAMLVNVSAND